MFLWWLRMLRVKYVQSLPSYKLTTTQMTTNKKFIQPIPITAAMSRTISVPSSFTIAAIVFTLILEVEEEEQSSSGITTVDILPSFNFLNHLYKETVCRFITNSSPYACWSSCHISTPLFPKRKQKRIAFRCSCLHCKSDILNSIWEIVTQNMQTHLSRH